MEALVDTAKSTDSGLSLLDLERSTGRTVYELFGAGYLAHHMENDGRPCPPCSMHSEMCRSSRESKRCVTIAPAKYAKSTWKSFIIPLVDGVLGLVAGDILLISNTGSLAEHWLRLIKEELEHNEMIRSHYGDLKGSIWRNDRIKLRTGIQIVSLGLQYQIRGTGWAKIIGDDLEDDEMVRSEDRRMHFEDWFDGALMGRMHPHTCVDLVGTNLHPLCKLGKIYDNDGGRYGDWTRLFFQATDEDGHSIWPERWPDDVLAKQRIEMGEKAWLSEKMNAPVFGKDHVFRSEWLRYYDSLPQNLYCVTWVDPSSSKEKEIGDYTVVQLWGKNLSESGSTGDAKKYYLRYQTRGRWSKHSKVKAALDVNREFHPVTNLISNDAYGKELKIAILEEAAKRGEYFPHRMVVESKNKIERAQMVTDLWERGDVFLPKRGAERFIEELLMFPFGDFDDCVDASVGALQHLRKVRKRPSRRKYIERPQLKPNLAGRLV